jgi:hypothetical protein
VWEKLKKKLLDISYLFVHLSAWKDSSATGFSEDLKFNGLKQVENFQIKKSEKNKEYSL